MRQSHGVPPSRAAGTRRGRVTMPAVARESMAAGPISLEAQHAEQLAEAVEPLVEQSTVRAS